METKSRAGLRVGGTMGVAAAGMVVLEYLGLPEMVAMAVVVLAGAGIRAGAQALGVAGLAGIVLLAGCGTFQSTSIEAAIDAGCEAALVANTRALDYLQSPEGRDDSPSERESIVAAMASARDACAVGRAAGQGDLTPAEREEKLSSALFDLAQRVPAVRGDPELGAALQALMEAGVELERESRASGSEEGIR